MKLERVAFYECVSTTVKMDVLSPHDEMLVGQDWISVKRPTRLFLNDAVLEREAYELAAQQIEALPERCSLFIAYSTPLLNPHIEKGKIRIGLFRSSSPELLELADENQPPSWYLPPVEGTSRYTVLMEEDA